VCRGRFGVFSVFFFLCSEAAAMRSGLRGRGQEKTELAFFAKFRCTVESRMPRKPHSNRKRDETRDNAPEKRVHHSAKAGSLWVQRVFPHGLLWPLNVTCSSQHINRHHAAAKATPSPMPSALDFLVFPGMPSFILVLQRHTEPLCVRRVCGSVVLT
jgi:hypothetical protein